MPNTGRPSRDCHACRKRRVKCDLARPECERCTRMGNRCPGYRDETSLLFRNESVNTLSEPASSRDRRRRTNERPEPSSSESSTPLSLSRQVTSAERAYSPITEDKLELADRLVLPRTWQVAPDLVPVSHWPAIASSLVLSMFSVVVNGTRSFGHASFLPETLRDSSPVAPSALCCNALAYAFLANKHPNDEGYAARDEAYGRALAATNKLVGDEELKDETAICAWLLSFYELVSHSNSGQDATGSVSWNVHALGLASLLRVRGPSQLNTRTGQQIFWQLATAAQIQALVAGTPYPDYIYPWLDQLDSTAIATYANSIEVTRFADRAAKLLAKINAAQTMSNIRTLEDTHENITRLWTDVSSLGMSAWQALIDDDDVVKQGCPLRADIGKIHLSNQYRICFIEILQAMLDLIQAFSSQDEELYDSTAIFYVSTQVNEQHRTFVSAVLKAAQLILNQDMSGASGEFPGGDASTKTCSICWTDGLRLLWPLRSIASRKSMLEEWQVRAVEAALEILSTRFSIRYANAPFSVG